jgi:hypothetical protein
VLCFLGMKSDDQKTVQQLEETPFRPLPPGGLKVAHRCKVDRSTNPPSTSGDMFSIDGVPLLAEMINGAVAVRINGRWFVAADLPGMKPVPVALLRQTWEECAPPKPTIT